MIFIVILMAMHHDVLEESYQGEELDKVAARFK
jgi:hypothetical protein